MTSSPLVSLCVPAYNSAAFIDASLESILSQKYPDFEVIVADNGSQDGTAEILKRYAAAGKIRLILNERNIGPFGNFNLLLTNARGNYVAIYHADDIYDSEIVAKSVGFLESFPEAALVGTLATVIDYSGRPQYPLMLPEGIADSCRMEFDTVFSSILKNGADRILLVTPSVMVRRSVYEELGLFDTSGRFASAGDYEMWLRIARRYPVAVLPKHLMKYRVHEGQGSERELRRNLELPDLMAVLEQYAEQIEDHDIRLTYDCYRSRTYLKTALKQNCAGDFSRSSNTADLIRSGRYLPACTLVRIANRFKINLRCWPGRQWPFRAVLD